jgi:hypothetical protein
VTEQISRDFKPTDNFQSMQFFVGMVRNRLEYMKINVEQKLNNVF